MPRSLPTESSLQKPDDNSLAVLCRRITGAEAVLILADGVATVVQQAVAPSFLPLLPAVLAVVRAGLPEEGAAFPAEMPVRIVRRAGIVLLVFGASPAVDEAEIVLVAELAAGQTAAAEAIAAARREAVFFRQIAEASTDTLVRGDLMGRRHYVSPSVRSLLGYAPEELVGLQAIDIVHPDDMPAMLRLVARIRDGTLKQGAVEIRQRALDGSWVWMEALVRLTLDPVTGVPDGYVASVRDIRRRKSIEQQLEHLATHDALTGLPNRAFLQTRLRQEFARLARSGQGFALMCIDLDRFKAINDNLGHQAGDAVLRMVADRLRARLRGEDTLARIGGDEFVALQCTGDDPEAAARETAGRLVAALDTPLDVEGHRLDVGISIGIAVAYRDGDGPKDGVALYRAADDALYRAKNSGRGCFSF